MKDEKIFNEKKICDVLINNTKYDLVDIPNKEHELGRYNNCSTTLWVKYNDFLSDENEYIPWIDLGSNRRCWDIEIKQRNNVKYKWNESRINGDVVIIIKLNNEPVYEFATFKLDYAFNKAQNIIYQLENHPLFEENDEVIGRKIYYKNLPAIITSKGVGYVIIEPDCPDEKLDEWWSKYTSPWDDRDEDYEREIREHGIKDDILSSNIFWYR